MLSENTARDLASINPDSFSQDGRAMAFFVMKCAKCPYLILKASPVVSRSDLVRAVAEKHAEIGRPDREKEIEGFEMIYVCSMMTHHRTC